MRRTNILIVVLVVLSCFFVYGTVYSNNITKEQAKKSVKDFENDQSLVFTKVELDTDFDELGTEFKIYELAKDLEMTWEVDAATGEVLMASYNDLFGFSEDPIPQNYTQSQCLAIAQAFAQSKYNDFDNMGFQLTKSKYDDEANNWDFLWFQQINNISGYNRVYVSVRPDTGQVAYYGVNRAGTANLPLPQVSSAQAESIAIADLDLVSEIDLRTQEIYYSRNGTLYWLIDVVGKNSSGDTTYSEIYINGVTGTIILKSSCILSVSDKPMKGADKAKSKETKKDKEKAK